MSRPFATLPDVGSRSSFKRACLRLFTEVPELNSMWMLTIGRPGEDGYRHHPIIVREVSEQYQRIHFEVDAPPDPATWGWLTYGEFTRKRIHGALEELR
jgi:hypothetical protein